MNKLQKWIAAASPADLRKLARLSGTSVNNLRQIAGGYRTHGKLRTTPELARRIERAIVNGPVGPFDILREDLCHACSRCELAKEARKV